MIFQIKSEQGAVMKELFNFICLLNLSDKCKGPSEACQKWSIAQTEQSVQASTETRFAAIAVPQDCSLCFSQTLLKTLERVLLKCNVHSIKLTNIKQKKHVSACRLACSVISYARLSSTITTRKTLSLGAQPA